MLILIELSKEHPTLPVSEVRACFEACGIDYIELYHNSVFVAEIKNADFEEFASRVAMSFSINELLGRNMKECLRNLSIEGSFKIEGGKYEMRKKLGELISKEKNAIVDLENPKTIIKIFSETYFCREIAKIDRGKFEARRPPARPFSTPVSMHPRIARAMVNLTKVKKNENLLDPFCGTGGLLIEAGSVGARAVGIDVKKKMVDGCIKNMEYYGIKNYEIIHGDMRKFEGDFEGGVDAIATDFPYGRSSHLSDEMKKLYAEAFEKMAEWLKDGRRAVAGLPSLEYRNVAKKYFRIEEIHCLRVHKSLTRYFYVLSKF